MSTFKNFVEFPDVFASDSAASDETCCEAEAGDWLCTRRLGHDMPHQAGSGYDGSRLYAQREDA